MLYKTCPSFDLMNKKFLNFLVGNSVRAVVSSILLLLLLFYMCLFNFQLSKSFDTYHHRGLPFMLRWSNSNSCSVSDVDVPINISHLMFGIAASMNSWRYRKSYVESWWQPNITRGYVFLDRPPSREFQPWSPSVPPFRVSDPMHLWKARPIGGKAIRVTRIFRTIMELFRQGDKDVRWYIMGDDDTIFFVENLVEVLSKYDHNKYYYIGSSSEFYMSNVYLSFDMAFGGAGYALSYPLVATLATMLEGCIQRYPRLFFSDYTLHLCLADLGVELTQEKGFHQIDFHGSISGILSSHPQSPILSLHHLDYVEPIFPSMDRFKAVYHLMRPAKLDQSRLLQQTICYLRETRWSFSVSWGYSTYIYEDIFPRSFLRKPMETFTQWIRKERPPFYMFNTRFPNNNPCEVPHMFFFDSIQSVSDDLIVTTYVRSTKRGLRACFQDGNHSADAISTIKVISPARKQAVAGRIECCDVYMAETNATEIRLRPCIDVEVVA